MENILLLKKSLKWNIKRAIHCLAFDLFHMIFIDNENKRIYYRTIDNDKSLKYFDYTNPDDAFNWTEIILSDKHKIYGENYGSPYVIKKSMDTNWDIVLVNFVNGNEVTLIKNINWIKVDSRDSTVYRNWVSCLNITKLWSSAESEERIYFDINWTNITLLFKEEILKIHQKDNEYSRMTKIDLSKTNFTNYIQVVNSDPSWFTIVTKLDWKTEREFLINFYNWKINTIRETLKYSKIKSIPIIWWKFIVTETLIYEKWKAYYSIMDINWNDIYVPKNWKALRVLWIDLLKPTNEEDVFIYDDSDWKIKIFWIDNVWLLSIKNNDVISSLNWQIKESEEKILKELFTANWNIRLSRIRWWAFTINIFDSEIDKDKQIYSSKMFKIDWTLIWENIKSPVNIKPFLWIQWLWEKAERSIISYYNSENTLLFTSDDIELPTGLASRQSQLRYGLDWILQFTDSRTQKSFILDEKIIFDRWEVLNKEIWWIKTPFLKINWKIFNKKHLK